MTIPPSPLSFEDILESLAEGVIAVGPDMRVSVFNQSAEKMTELSRSFVLGKPLDACFKRNPRIAEMLRETMDKGRIFAEYEEKLWRRITGDALPVSVTTSLVFDPEGSLRGAVALLKDLSGIKPLETSALRKERLAYIGAFAANLAHEIRNPLSGIRGAAQLLSRKASDKGLNEYMEVIIKEADRLNGILNEMLDFARPARLVKKPVNIHQVLDSVVLLLEEGAGRHTFVKSYDPSIPEVAGDEGQLKQVFLNLVKNAVEAIPESGIVSVTTRAITEFHMGEGGTGRMVSIEVRDTGCGIRPEDLENVFTPFFTTKPKGSGLGMAITLKIVKEHGGHLKIASEPGEGTSVLVYLPVDDRGAG
ncbi:MAG: PAS domain-containing protein [Deltaproteobacteria bacterium]|nr:PAS domain-containing protein [Deltaproteobacteria bacterium]MCL4873719.1 PAS domain-containing protein [bacterium]